MSGRNGTKRANKARRAISLVLVLLLFVLELPLSALTSSAEGVYTINGKNIRASDFSSSPGECWKYANAIYNKIWGVNFTSDFSDNNNFLRDLSDDELLLTTDNLREFVSAAALGSVLRICNPTNLHANDGYINGEKPGHSQVIVQKDSEGFTVVQGGLDASPHRREDYYTWQSFVNTWWLGGTYSYIKYIKWPGSPSYKNVRDSANREPVVTGAAYPTGTLLCGKRLTLEGVIYSVSPIVQVSCSVTDMTGADALTRYTLRMNNNSYDISNDGLDSAMPFATLAPGGYTYKVEIKNQLGEDFTVIESFFTVAASKKKNEDVIYNFLINQGYNTAVACGILANIEHESDFKPDSLYYEVGDYYSHGLIQWNHNRYDRLLAFLQERGYDEYSIEGQLLFMIHELETVSYYRGALDAINKAANTSAGAYDVAYAFCKYYEMPSDTENRSKSRGRLAQSYFERYTIAGDVVVSFNARGGTKVSDKTVKYAGLYGELPTPTRAGDIFCGWHTMPEGGTLVSATDTVWVNHDQTVYAHWRGREYTIDLVLDEESTFRIDYLHGEYVVFPPDMAKENYVFAGWYESADYSGSPVEVLTPADYGNKTYYAKWELYTGFRQDPDGVRYIRNGEVVTGWLKIKGNTFYFTVGKKGASICDVTAVIGKKPYEFESFLYEGMTLYRLKEVKNGLVCEDNGVRMYVDDVYQTGWQLIGNDRLYFDPSTGLMETSELVIGKKTYSFEPFRWEDFELWREIKQGLYEEEGGIRYYENGVMVTGWHSFVGNNVYFSPEDGKMVTVTTMINGELHPFKSFVYNGWVLYKSIYQKTGFFKEGIGIRYYEAGQYATAWKTVDGNKMFFDLDSGYMVNYNCTLGGVWYDFEPFEKDNLTLYRVVKNGFVRSADGIRYYKDSEFQIGWKTVEGNRMYFDQNGSMIDCDTKIGTRVYAFDPIEYDGMTLYVCRGTRNGFYSEECGIRYYSDGIYQTGWQTIDGKTMYFRRFDGAMVGGNAMIGGLLYEFEPFFYMGLTLFKCKGLKTGFNADEDGVRYYVDGNYLTGWQEINGRMMYFKMATGVMVEGPVVAIGGKDRYFESFRMDGLTLWREKNTKNGFFEEEGGVRFYRDGKYLTGWQEINGSTMYFRVANGTMSHGGTIGGLLYEFEKFTYQGMTLWRKKCLKTGFQAGEGGVRYYVDGNYLTGWQEIDGRRMYFKLSNGVMVEGPIVVIGGKDRYFESFTQDGLTLWREKDTKNGFFAEENGVRYYQDGTAVNGWLEYGGSTLYFRKSNGTMVKGGSTIGGLWYDFEEYVYQGLTLYRCIGKKNGFYAEEDGVRCYNNGEMLTGWQEIDGRMMYFKLATGYMLGGEIVTVGGLLYDFEPFDQAGLTLWASRGLKSGFSADEGGVRCYNNGEMLTGWQEIDGRMMYFKLATGYMLGGEIITIGGKDRYFESFTQDGLTLWREKDTKNGFFKEKDGVRYYQDGTAVNGWLEYGGRTLYFKKSDSTMFKGSSAIDGVWYEFEKYTYQGLTLYSSTGVKNGFYAEKSGVRCYNNGEMLTGWQEIDGNTMYFKLSNGVMVEGPIVVIGGKDRYFESFTRDGMTLWREKSTKNGFFEEEGGVRFYRDGEYLTRWQEINGSTMYFRVANGTMSHGGTIGGLLYEFEEFTYQGLTLYRSHGPKTGLRAESDGVRYYVNGKSVSGWQEIDGNRMYFRYSDGLMSHGGTIGGVYYTFEEFTYEGLTLYRCIDDQNG